MFGPVWTNRAYDDLADIWVAADRAHRDRLEAAVVQLNADLRDGADTFGESREGGWRIGFASPLAVTYRIDPDTAVAVVYHVWLYGK